MKIKNRYTDQVIFTTSDTDLQGANLQGANLQGANHEKITIKQAVVFTGLYKYLSMPIIATDGAQYIRLGCFTRTHEDWQADFWNNRLEFPNDGDTASADRLNAFNACIAWLDIHAKAKEHQP